MEEIKEKRLAIAGLTIFVMRALGIPVTREITLQWPNTSIGHTWNAVYDNGGYVSFMGAGYFETHTERFG